MARPHGRGPFEPFETGPFEGIQEIRIPRPPRRFWVGLGFIGAALAVIFLTAPLVGFITENQWYEALGIGPVYRTRVGLEALLFFVGLAVAFAFAAGNAALALRLRSGLALRALGVRQRAVLTPAGYMAMGASALLALILAAGARTNWTNLALFLHYTPTGVVDPVYGMDVSFYLLQLPFLDALVGWLFGLVFMTGLIVVVVYAWRGDTIDLRLSPRAVAHLSAILGVFGLVAAAGAFLGRLELVFAHNGVVWGAGYTDVHARSWLSALQGVLAVGLAGLLFANVWLRRAQLLPSVVVIWVVVWILAALYPAAVQRFTVQPSELSQESPYIKREIEFTRRAYGISDVQVRPYGGDATITPQQVAADSATIDNLRLWDDKQIRETYQQLQSIRTYYSFHQIDLDRYQINGTLKQVEISARELDQRRLPPQAQNWVNQKLVYTHGYGVAASPVSAVVGDGLPDYVAGDIPPTGPLQVSRPDIYFGQLTTDFVLAPSRTSEFDYPQRDQNVVTHYKGSHGVSMAGANRLLWSLRAGDFNLLISPQIDDHTQILFRREVRSRVSAIAPFLSFYDDPYVVVVDGRIYWIQDAYVAADTYPYSQPVPDQVALAAGHNYLRNSVKVVIDAYEGTPTFYVADPTDPIIRAYAATFPGLFHPLPAMPAGLQAHLRVPPKQFEVQANLYATYHISDPTVLYEREDVWDLPLEPYYVLMRLPGETQPEYLQIIPFTPRGKQNLVAWLAVRNDPGHYGEMVAFALPKDKVIQGPQQVISRIQQTPEFSRDKTLFNQQGSSILEGNLLVVPIGDSFLYVQPIYLRATSSAQGLPELKRVILADATGSTPVAYQPTLAEALSQLVGQQVSAPGQTTQPTPPAGSNATQQQIASLVAQANQLYAEARAALQRGDLATYAQDVQKIGDILAQVQQLLQGGPVPRASPQPSPRTSP